MIIHVIIFCPSVCSISLIVLFLLSLLLSFTFPFLFLSSFLSNLQNKEDDNKWRPLAFLSFSSSSLLFGFLSKKPANFFMDTRRTLDLSTKKIADLQLSIDRPVETKQLSKIPVRFFSLGVQYTKTCIFT